MPDQWPGIGFLIPTLVPGDAEDWRAHQAGASTLPSSSPVLERQRVANLVSYDILDTACETVFDELTRLAAKLAGTPIALFSLIDSRRQWLKARVGFDPVETSREESFCVHALGNPSAMLEVPDTTLDPRFRDNPVVTGPHGIRFYAGMPLVSPEGHVLGTLCVLDTVPRTLDPDQRDSLCALAHAVMTTLELRRSRRRAQELALTDPLTHLLNRRAFRDAVRRSISQQGRTGQPFGLIHLDLDGFRQLNGGAGHVSGDTILREVARILSFAVRREDIVARLGGDEFAVLLDGVGTEDIAQAIGGAIRRQMHAAGWPVTASVGSVTFHAPPSDEVAATLAADEMMHAARQAGGDRCCHGERGGRPGPAVSPPATVPGNPAAPARTGFDPRRLQAYFQPIVDLRTGVVTGVEALARLEDGNQVLSPAAFLPGLSRADLRVLLFAMLDQAVAMLARCRGTHPALTASVNVDPALLLEADFAAALLARLAAQGADNARITLEILENGETLNQEVAGRHLDELRANRVRIALDDVGSGYSSLTRLRELPIDSVKLDQVFIRGVGQRPSDLLFVTNMMSLAEGLGMSFVVEGVETPEILDALGVMGVGLAQGYALARPMPLPALQHWLAHHVPVPARRQPTSLLGTYASHLNIVQATDALTRQPLQVTWLEQSFDPHSCLIGRFFDENGLHDTPYGLAHKRFHTVLALYDTDKAKWEEAAETFRTELEIAIRRQGYATPA